MYSIIVLSLVHMMLLCDAQLTCCGVHGLLVLCYVCVRIVA